MAERKPTAQKLRDREFWMQHRDFLERVEVSSRDRELVIRVFGLDGGAMETLAQAGFSYHIGAERVRQILNQVRSKVRREIKRMQKFDVCELELRNAPIQALREAGINNFYGLSQHTAAQLLAMPHTGEVTVQDIRRQLREHPDGPFFLKGEVD